MTAPAPRWDELERLATARLAEAGSDLAAVRASIEGMPGAGTGEQLHHAAIRAGIAVGGPPASEDGLRQIAGVLGLVLAASAAPAAA